MTQLSMSASIRDRAVALFWMLAATISVLVVAATVQRLLLPFPLHFWEGGFIADAHRVSMGESAYHPIGEGTATHMYGPLETYAAGTIFRLTGPSFLPLRLISVLSCWGVIAAIVILFRPRGVRLCAMAAVAMLLEVGGPLRDFVEPRPDGVSMLLGMGALLCFYRSFQRLSWPTHIAGVVLMLVAMFFKQPAVMVAAVPAVAAFLLQPAFWRYDWQRLLMLAVPLLAMVAALRVTALTTPVVFLYMVKIPSQYSIRAEMFLQWVICLPLSVPLFWIAVASLSPRSRRQLLKDPQACWLMATIFVTSGAGILVAAKVGGMSNALVPALFSTTALFLYLSRPLELRLTRISPFREDYTKAQVLLACAMPLLLVVPVLVYRSGSIRVDVGFGSPDYAQVVDFIQNSRDKVACPQDPSLLVFGGQSPGRCVIFEHGAAGWPDPPPEYYWDDLDDAEYAISVGEEDWRTWPLRSPDRDAQFTQRGFQQLPLPEFQQGIYRVWQRSSPAD